MKQELKDKWCKALRSGEFEQGKEYLFNKNNNTYCCLGVLHKIQNLEEKSALTDTDVKGAFNFGSSIDYEAFETETGLVYHQVSKLANMNDTGCSFNEIADYIEENINAV